MLILWEGTFLHLDKHKRIYITGGNLNGEMKIILEIAPRTLCWESLFLQSLPVPTGLAGRVCHGHRSWLLFTWVTSQGYVWSEQPWCWYSTSPGAESRLLYRHVNQWFPRPRAPLRYCNQLCAWHLSSASYVYVATERTGWGGEMTQTNRKLMLLSVPWIRKLFLSYPGGLLLPVSVKEQQQA